MGSSKNLNTANAEFKTAWKASEGPDHAGAAGGGLRGDEHSGRRLKDGPTARKVGRIPAVDQRVALEEVREYSAMRLTVEWLVGSKRIAGTAPVTARVIGGAHVMPD